MAKLYCSKCGWIETTRKVGSRCFLRTNGKRCTCVLRKAETWGKFKRSAHPKELFCANCGWQNTTKTAGDRCSKDLGDRNYCSKVLRSTVEDQRGRYLKERHEMVSALPEEFIVNYRTTGDVLLVPSLVTKARKDLTTVGLPEIERLAIETTLRIWTD